MPLLLAFALAAPVAVPVQGQLTDATGAALNGVHTITFHLWDAPSGGEPVRSGTVPVSFVRGGFAAMLQAGSPTLDADVFHGANRWLSLAIAGDTESERAPLGATPYAASAQRAERADVAATAERLGSLVPEDVVTWDATIPWSMLDRSGAAGDGLFVDEGGSLALDRADVYDAPGELSAALDGRYLQSSDAASTYLTQANAASTYLTPTSAASTYLTQTNAASTYFPKAGGAFGGGVSGTTANFSGTVTGGTFSGSGASLTNLPAANLTGSLPDAALSSNIARALQPQPVWGAAVSVGDDTNLNSGSHGRTNLAGLSVTLNKRRAGSGIVVMVDLNVRVRYNHGDRCAAWIAASGAGYSGDYGSADWYHGAGDDSAGHDQGALFAYLPANGNTGNVTITVSGQAVDSGAGTTDCYYGHRATQSIIAFELN